MSTVTRKDSLSTSSVGRSSASGDAKAAEDAPSLDDIAGGTPADAAARFEGKAGADPDAALGTIKGKLDEWHISDADARQCVDELRNLTPADRARVWEAMGPESQARLLDNVDDVARSRLLDSLSDAGMMKQVEAPPHPNATTTSQRLVGKHVWGNPPDGPTFLVRNPKLSPALQKAVHEENVARADAYRERYDAYIAAYKNEVVLPAAKNDDIASIRRVGPPGPLLLPEREPGAPLGAKGPGEVDRADAWRKVADPTQALVDVYGPITRAIHHARGEMMAGELRFSAEAAVALGGVLEYGVKGDIGQDGDLNLTEKARLGYAASNEAKTAGGGASVSEDGVTVGGTQSDALRDPLFQESGKEPARTDGSASVTVGRNREGDFDLKSIEGSVGVLGMGADFDKGTANVSVGKAWEGKFAKLSAKVTAEFKPFLGADEIGLFRKDDGFFDVPPEIAQGKAWSELSEERRDDLATTFGWGPKEWADVSRRHAKLEVPTMMR